SHADADADAADALAEAQDAASASQEHMHTHAPPQADAPADVCPSGHPTIPVVPVPASAPEPTTLPPGHPAASRAVPASAPDPTLPHAHAAAAASRAARAFRVKTETVGRVHPHVEAAVVEIELTDATFLPTPLSSPPTASTTTPTSASIDHPLVRV